HHHAGIDRPRHLPPPRQDKARGVRSTRPARWPAPGVRRGDPAARFRRSPMGTDRRAVSRPRSHRRGARGVPQSGWPPGRADRGAKVMLTTYFAGLADNLSVATALPTHGLHIDLVRAPEQLDALLTAWPKGRVLSLGVVDGRNIWRTDLEAALRLLERAVSKI